MKNCKQCGKEFSESPTRTGHEQVYCSSSCRMKAANKRREDRLRNTYFQQPVKQITNERQEATTTQTNELSLHQRQDRLPSTNGSDYVDNYLTLLQRITDAKIEAVSERIMRENAERRLKEIEEELLEDDEDDEDDNPDKMSIFSVGGIKQLVENDRVMGLAQLLMMRKQGE